MVTSSCRIILLNILTINLIQNSFCGNILYVSTVASPSHHIWNRALAFGLVRNGHNLTFIGFDQDNLKKTPENYTLIHMEGIYEKLYSNFDINELALYGTWKMIRFFQDWSWFQCQKGLQTNGFKQLLNYPRNFKFDLIIYDTTVGPCYYPLIQFFNFPPAIGVTPFLLPPYNSINFGNPLVPTYIPWYGLRYTQDMSFFERLWNTLWMYFDILLKNYYEYSIDDEWSKEVFGSQTPSWRNFERNITLLLANTDAILDNPQPLTPNIIPVGGLHTTKAKKVPQEFEKVFNKSKHGVIVFSLGTNVQSQKLTEKQKQGIIGAFSKLDETVIWKYEGPIKDLPPNVVTSKWLPQNDLLSHPSVKLFIGHGGTLSTQEAMFHGIPMIGIPFFFDQYVNVRMLVNKKLGLEIDSKKMEADNIYKTIREVLDNPIYRENMRLVSNRFQDQPETPLDRAIYWVNYAIKHNGAHFLNTKARDIPFYKLYNLDLELILITIFIIILLLILKLINFNRKTKLNEKYKMN